MKTSKNTFTPAANDYAHRGRCILKRGRDCQGKRLSSEELLRLAPTFLSFPSSTSSSTTENTTSKPSNLHRTTISQRSTLRVNTSQDIHQYKSTRSSIQFNTSINTSQHAHQYKPTRGRSTAAAFFILSLCRLQLERPCRFRFFLAPIKSANCSTEHIVLTLCV